MVTGKSCYPGKHNAVKMQSSQNQKQQNKKEIKRNQIITIQCTSSTRSKIIFSYGSVEMKEKHKHGIFVYPACCPSLHSHSKNKKYKTGLGTKKEFMH